MKPGSFDLNLLAVFDAIYRHRSVTQAGERLGLSQPAVSHALRRLRWLLKDELFVKAPEGMMPTPRAEQLAEPVRHALNQLLLALEPEDFDPSTAVRNFRLAVNNYAAVVLAGPIINKCAAAAPGLSLSLRPSGTLNIAELLERGDLDLVITSQSLTPDRFVTRPLVEDRYVATMRRGHGAVPADLSIAIFAALPHLSISSSGEDLSFIDAALAEHGLTRRIALEVPYLSAGSVLMQSDMLAVLGGHLAEEFCRSYPLQMRELPVASPMLRTNMIWHRRLDNVPSHVWLRATIISVAEGFAPASQSKIAHG